MQKWRYHSLLMRDLSIADSKLNSEGERGWELVSVCLVDHNTARAYFKQPILEEAQPHSDNFNEGARVGGGDFERDAAIVGQTPFG